MSLYEGYFGYREIVTYFDIEGNEYRGVIIEDINIEDGELLHLINIPEHYLKAPGAPANQRIWVKKDYSDSLVSCASKQYSCPVCKKRRFYSEYPFKWHIKNKHPGDYQEICRRVADFDGYVHRYLKQMRLLRRND